MQTAALRAIGNIVAGDDLQTQVAISSGVLPALQPLLRSPHKIIRRETCRAISNIILCLPEVVIEANVMPELIEILQGGDDLSIKLECCWAIFNTTIRGRQETSRSRYLIAQGCIRLLCDLLMLVDDKIILLALDCLKNIFEVGEMDRAAAAGPGAWNEFAILVQEIGGVVIISNLQEHESLTIGVSVFDIHGKNNSAVSQPGIPRHEQILPGRQRTRP